MPESTAPSDVRADATPTCIVCGYDLRAAPAEGKCPECGTDVERSIHGDWLRFADQRWVEELLRGLSWVWTSMKVLIGVFVLTMFGGGLAFLFDPAAPNPIVRGLLFATLAMNCSGLAFVVFGMALGLWMMTSPEPRVAGFEPMRPKLLRFLSVAVLPAMIVGFLWPLRWTRVSPVPFQGLPTTPSAWFELLLCILLVVVIGSQAYLLLIQIQMVEERCGGFDKHRRNLLEKYRRVIAGLTIAALILSIATSLLIGIVMGPGWLGFPWLAAAGLTSETRRRVRCELSCARHASTETRT